MTTKATTVGLVRDIRHCMEMYPEEDVAEIVRRVEVEPELLQAAKDALAYMEVRADKMTPTEAQFLVNIRAAIAKEEGRA